MTNLENFYEQMAWQVVEPVEGCLASKEEALEGFRAELAAQLAHAYQYGQSGGGYDLDQWTDAVIGQLAEAIVARRGPTIKSQVQTAPPVQPQVCGYCSQENCDALFGASVCGQGGPGC